MTRPDNVSPVASRLPRARIVRRRDFTGDLFLLWLEPDIDFNFAPGQYITIGAGGVERPYSIASAPFEPLIELFIEYLPPEQGGTLTPLLYAQNVGDVLTIRPRAKGRFTLSAGVVNHVMVATVTGVAPYVSMLRQFVHDREEGPKDSEDCRFFLLQGASYRDEFGYDRELSILSERYPDLIRFVPSVSRPSSDRNSGWTGATGRVNFLIEEYLARWHLRKDDTLVYLCGHPGMIDDARARLIPGGWSVVAERFWVL